MGHKREWVVRYPRQGDTYLGMWSLSLNQPEGYGCMKYDSGNHDYYRSYSGGWKAGKFHGPGSLIFCNGEYVGGFKDGKRDGEGVEIYLHAIPEEIKGRNTVAITFKGFYHHNQKVRGIISIDSPISLSYQGGFDDNGLFDGDALVTINGCQELRTYKNGVWIDNLGNSQQKPDMLKYLGGVNEFKVGL